MTVLRAPFPWFGGKRRAAHLVWPRFGDLPNYCEPFFGSGAVLLARPTPARIETVNDIDATVCNFWRAAQGDPQQVAWWADWPINEVDLHARHKWLVARIPELTRQLDEDPRYFDSQFAGWWVWGICQWIGSGWCASAQWVNRRREGRAQRGAKTESHATRPDLTAARGLLSAARRVRDLTGAANWEKRPQLGKGGRGVLSHTWQQLPAIGGSRGASGAGIHASGKMPKMDRGTGSRLASTREAILDWMRLLQERLRMVRVCRGDWKRILGPSPTVHIGLTGVFLDPPYSDDGRDPSIYGHDDLEIAHQVREWAIEHGDNPKLRVALCGYAGEHKMPESWSCVPWKANGGYSNQRKGNENATRERIWFSPHCLPNVQTSLFREAS